jgi:hypothetical protein
VEVNLPIQRSGETHTVGDHQKTASGSPDQVAGETEDVVRRRLIEISGGLVGEQEKRLYRQCATDGDALLLTTGQLLGIAF